jgi:hypothetical protein
MPSRFIIRMTVIAFHTPPRGDTIARLVSFAAHSIQAGAATAVVAVEQRAALKMEGWKCANQPMRQGRGPDMRFDRKRFLIAAAVSLSAA